MLNKNTFFSVFLASIVLVSCDYKTVNDISKKVTEATDTKKTLPSISPSTLATPSSLITPSASTVPNLIGTFDIKKTTEVVTNKCTVCHSIKPTDTGRTKAAAGITFDSEKEILAQMDMIKKVTFTNRSMPTGKITMTDDERNVIGLFGNQAQATPVKLEIKDAPSVITRKCASCHSLTPDPTSGYTSAPEGFKVDSQQEMISQAREIKKETFTKRSMPVGNITITEEERSIIASWCDQQGTNSTIAYGREENDD